MKQKRTLHVVQMATKMRILTQMYSKVVCGLSTVAAGVGCVQFSQRVSNIGEHSPSAVRGSPGPNVFDACIIKPQKRSQEFLASGP